ncbi:MAG: sulfatase-like hydrolase/transferase [Planctomycetota bacterium]|nr:sulfatase-like hydrolase/transferase [Planctomycetota bacterium]
MPFAMNRRTFLKTMGMGAAGLAVPACLGMGDRPGRAAGRRPNILFVYADDHAYQSISAYGSKINQTPNIDRLAREGMLFQECYVTNSICGPMRAVVLTGKYSHLNGMYRNGVEFDQDQQTFPKLLQKAGYQTAVIGKYHLGHKKDPQGFDYYEILIDQGPYYNPPMIKKGEGRVKHTGYTTDIITDLALGWLKNGRDADKPFMLMYQHKAPHRNWQPGPKYLTMYDDRTIPEPDSLFESYEGRPTPVKEQDMTIAKTMNASDLKLKPPGDLTPEQRQAWDAAYEPKNEAFRKANLQGKELVRWKYQRYIKDYLRCIASIDDNLGRVLDYLDESGLASNTIVVYASDQGFYLGEHGWFDKRWIYEQSLRTPFIVRWPEVVKPGSTCSAIASPLDFAETFLDAAGVPAPDDMQGRSLVPLLRGETPADWRKTHYYHYYEGGGHGVRRHYGVCDGRYKLIHFYELGVDEWELVDLKANPGENKNFYNDPKYADVRRRLHAELVRLQQVYNVPPNDPDGKPHAPQPKVL